MRPCSSSWIDLVAGVAHDADTQLRIERLDLRNAVHHQVRRGAHDGADGQVAIPALLARHQVFGATVEATQRRLGKVDQLLAQRRWPHPPWQALEQVAAEHIFNLAQHARGRRLRHVQGLGCTVQVLTGTERYQHMQMLVAQAVEQAAGEDGTTHKFLITDTLRVSLVSEIRFVAYCSAAVQSVP